jgi:hypothetical protein
VHPLSGLAAFVAALVLGVAGASAQDPLDAVERLPPDARAKLQTALMQEKLALTPVQLPKVEAINLATAQKMQPVLEGRQGALMRLREMRANEAERDTALQGVLTPQQFQQWLAAKDEIRQKVEEKAVERGAAGAP